MFAGCGPIGRVRDSWEESGMFGYRGDDLAVFIALLTLSVPFVIEGIKSHGRERVLWWLAATVFIVTGLAWDRVKTLSPPAARFATAIATNPVTWFVLAIFGLAWLIYSRDKLRHSKPDEHYSAGLIAASLAEELREITANPFLRHDSDPSARITAELIRLQNLGLDVPYFPADMNPQEKRTTMTYYLDNVGTLLMQGFTKEARQMAKQISQPFKPPQG